MKSEEPKYNILDRVNEAHAIICEIQSETKKIYLDDDLRENKNPAEDLEGETRAKVLYLLRDAEQSSLVDGEWVLNSEKLSKSCIKAAEAGFGAIEIAGGRFFEMSLKQGNSCFKILKEVRKNLDEAGFPDVDLQVLARGANGMGFAYQDPTVVEALIEEHEKAGITIVRTFDALNDLDNINSYGNLHNQSAIAYDRDYSVNHYLIFAKKLKEEKGAQSFCIKDMGGQLDEKSLEELLKELQNLGLKITLHMHSTDEKKSFRVISKALELGIDGIEVAPLGLSGGASHHEIEKFLKDDALKSRIQEINEENLNHLNDYVEEIFKNKKRQNLATLFPKMSEEDRTDILQQFCEAGLPGGAIPSILFDLKKYAEKKYGSLEEALNVYFGELKQVKKDAGNPPLVTPSADIVSKQAIFNIATNPSFNTNSDDINVRYGNIEKRFADLVMGHYGWIHDYEKEIINMPESELVQKVTEQYSNLENLLEKNTHPSEKTDYLTMDDYLEKVEVFRQELIDRFKDSGETKNNAEEIAQIIFDSFGTERQIALAFAMPPGGKQKQARNLEGQAYIEYMIECRQMKFKKDLKKLIISALSELNIDLSEDFGTHFEALKNYSGEVLSRPEFTDFGIRNKADAQNILLKAFCLAAESGKLPQSYNKSSKKIKRGTGFKTPQEVSTKTPPLPEKSGLKKIAIQTGI